MNIMKILSEAKERTSLAKPWLDKAKDIIKNATVSKELTKHIGGKTIAIDPHAEMLDKGHWLIISRDNKSAWIITAENATTCLVHNISTGKAYRTKFKDLPEQEPIKTAWNNGYGFLLEV